MAARQIREISVNSIAKFHATTFGDTIQVFNTEQLNRVEKGVPFKALFNHDQAVGIMTERGLALVYASPRQGRVFGDADDSVNWSEAMGRLSQSLN